MSTTLLSPVVGTITSGYGPRKSPGGIGSTNHQGVDIARGSLQIATPADGVVVASRYNIYRGHYVQVDHGHGVRTLHQHLAKRYVAVGARVTVGTPIGHMGRTGLVTGVHLHTEVTIGGIIVNPYIWYAEQGVRLGTADVGTLKVAVAAAPPAPASGHTLQVGSSGTMVEALQAGLRKVFPAYRYAITLHNRRLIRVDGSFGAETKAWVQEFQRRVGIDPDGIVGPVTMRELGKFGIHL